MSPPRGLDGYIKLLKDTGGHGIGEAQFRVFRQQRLYLYIFGDPLQVQPRTVVLGLNLLSAW